VLPPRASSSDEQRPDTASISFDEPDVSSLPSVEELANHPRLLRYVPYACDQYFVEANRKILAKYVSAYHQDDKVAQHYWIVRWMQLPSQTLASIKAGHRKTKSVILDRLTNYNKNFYSTDHHVVEGALDSVNDIEQKMESKQPNELIISDRTEDQDAACPPFHVIRAKKLVANNHLGKAVRSLLQTNPPIAIDEGDCKQKLERLHPKSKEDLSRDPIIRDASSTCPPVVIGHEPHGDLVKTIRFLANGSAPGPSGWSGEMLLNVARNPECLQHLAALCTNIQNGNLPATTKPYLLASRLVPIEKNDRGDIRPIAVGEVVYRAVSSRATHQVAGEAAKILLPHQYAVGISGGCEMIVHDLQHTLEQRSLHVAAISVDFRNAFNSISRKACLHSLMAHKELQSLWKLAAFAYSEPSMLLSRRSNGSMTCELWSEQGARQGDPLGVLLFCLGLHPILQRASALAPSEVSSKCYVDDMTLVGPPEKLIPVYTFIETESRKIGLEVQPSKCQFLYFHQSTHPLPNRVQKFIDDNIFELQQEGAVLLGAPIAKDTASCKRLLKKLVKTQDSLLLAWKSPHLSLQETFLMLRVCGIPILNYLLRVVRPSIMKDIAASFHSQLTHLALQKLEISDCSASDPFVWTKAMQQIQLPVKAGGMGLVNLSRLSDISYCSSLAHAIEYSSKHPQITLHSVSYRTSPVLNEVLQQQLRDALSLIHSNIHDAEALKGLPSAPAEFHNRFGELAARAVNTTEAQMRSKKLQHILTAALHQADREQLLKCDGWQVEKEVLNIFKARHLAVTAPKAHTWSIVVPSEPALTLKNHEYQLATRVRLGLKPMDHLGIRCRACKNRIKGDECHFLSCYSKLTVPMTMRHNLVVKALGSLIELSGGIHREEPTHINFQQPKENFRRTDIEAILDSHHILVDVSVITPTSSSAILRGAASQQLAAARATSKLKIQKHRENATILQAKFVPFVMESFGGLSPECRHFLSSLVYYAVDNVSPAAYSRLISILYASIAIAVQRGNALMFKKCISIPCQPVQIAASA